MNKDRFIALVNNPALLKAEDAPFLEELLNEYPYFQSAHLLAARCYKITDSIHLQKQIKKAAAHITDRRVLYNLIENFQIAIPVEPDEKVSTIESVKAPEWIEPAPLKENLEVVVEQTLEPLTAIQEELLVANGIVEPELIEISNQETNLEVEAIATIDEVESKSDNHTIHDTEYQPTLEKTEEKLHFEAEIPLENEIKLALAETLYLKEFELIATEKVEKTAESQIESSEKVENEPEIVKEEGVEEEITKSQENNESQTAFVAWLKKLQMQPVKQENRLAPKPTNEGEKLIEAFMEKPIQRAKPVKQEFYSPVNMAKQSVTDNDFFVTETLAKIYIKQGNLTKAIKVYQNLSLKNPEKNTFFAAQIKILKEQLHNKSGK
jgi:hypothetical protein